MLVLEYEALAEDELDLRPDRTGNDSVLGVGNRFMGTARRVSLYLERDGVREPVGELLEEPLEISIHFPRFRQEGVKAEDVQLFRIGVSPDTGRDLLLKYVETANSLAAQPQWYNSLTTNCTTVVMALIRSFAEDVPMDWRLLANGYLPEFAWEQGVLDQSRSVEDLRALGSITPIAQAHGVGPDYSAMIREGVPAPAQD